jgi:hypothetical protein
MRLSFTSAAAVVAVAGLMGAASGASAEEALTNPSRQRPA